VDSKLVPVTKPVLAEAAGQRPAAHRLPIAVQPPLVPVPVRHDAEGLVAVVATVTFFSCSCLRHICNQAENMGM
jgi:hypothetical protein